MREHVLPTVDNAVVRVTVRGVEYRAPAPAPAPAAAAGSGAQAPSACAATTATHATTNGDHNRTTINNFDLAGLGGGDERIQAHVKDRAISFTDALMRNVGDLAQGIAMARDAALQPPP